MAKKKAKWLEESTNQELISEVMEKVLLGDEIEKKDTTRAVKALEELQERLPNEGEEVSLEEALSQLEDSLKKGIELAKSAYESELEAIEDEEPEEVEDEEEDIEEEEDDEDDEDDDIEDEDEMDYEDLTVKELRAECRKKGITVKGLKKPDMIEALQGLVEDEDDEDLDDEDTEDIEEDEDIEDIEDDEDEMDYEELSTRALKELMKDRGIKVKKGMKKKELIKALEADDQE